MLYLCAMIFIKRWFVWLSRIRHCKGFGIQSPTDYAFVRYVVNEHWPYYAYDNLRGNDSLDTKLGKLYFRLSNWRQPHIMLYDRWNEWWKAGCRSIRFTDEIDRVELLLIDVEDIDVWQRMMTLCDEQSVVVVENIYRNSEKWSDISECPRVWTTFDLYYCGIVLFDKRRYKKHYIINF